MIDHGPSPQAGEEPVDIFARLRNVRVKHSGPAARFCVLCLSGEHERTNEERDA